MHLRDLIADCLRVKSNHAKSITDYYNLIQLLLLFFFCDISAIIHSYYLMQFSIIINVYVSRKYSTTCNNTYENETITRASTATFVI